jgi:hypothetical protein
MEYDKWYLVQWNIWPNSVMEYDDKHYPVQSNIFSVYEECIIKGHLYMKECVKLLVGAILPTSHHFMDTTYLSVIRVHQT